MLVTTVPGTPPAPFFNKIENLNYLSALCGELQRARLWNAIGPTPYTSVPSRDDPAELYSEHRRGLLLQTLYSDPVTKVSSSPAMLTSSVRSLGVYVCVALIFRKIAHVMALR